jgi:hypothetical protein
MQITPKVTLETIRTWLEKAAKEKTWVILMFHQIDESNNEWSMTPAMFQQTLTIIQEIDIPVVTASEALSITQ